MTSQTRIFWHARLVDGGALRVRAYTAVVCVLTIPQNGPIHVLSNGSWVLNPFSWNSLADTIWIDQPVGAHFTLGFGSSRCADGRYVGTGFSTSDAKGYGEFS